jgi:hypothetical protein
MQFLGMALFLTLPACVLGEALKQHFYVDSPDSTNPANLDLSAIFAAQAEPVSKPRSHQRRWGGFPPGPAGDALWNTAKCKGRKFMAQMSYSDYDAGQALPVPASTVQSPWRFSKCSEYRSLRYERITNTMHADDLIPWGYFFSAPRKSTPTSKQAATGVSRTCSDTWAFQIDVNRTADSGMQGALRTIGQALPVSHPTLRNSSRHISIRMESSEGSVSLRIIIDFSCDYKDLTDISSRLPARCSTWP